jgi:hypothetical protein
MLWLMRAGQQHAENSVLSLEPQVRWQIEYLQQNRSRCMGIAVTGAIVCSRVTYSICRYDSNNRSRKGYSYEDFRENIVVTSNAIIF